MTSFEVGSLVRARGREWVVLPETEKDLLVLRPLGGTEVEVTGIYVGPSENGLPFERVESASSPLPDPAKDLGNYLCTEGGLLPSDLLRAGVEAAITALGTGFLRPKHANRALHEALERGELDKQDYYRQLLRLVYRLIFLFVAEDRDALLPPDAPAAARSRYERFYTTKRLRDLAGKRRGGQHPDLWRQLRLVLVEPGCERVLLPVRSANSIGCGSFVTAGNHAKFSYLTTRRRGLGIGSGTSPSA